MTPTPTAAADSQPSEEQAESRKRSGTAITPTATSQDTSKKPRRRNEADEEDKICPPGPKTEKAGKGKEQKQYPRRKYTAWGDIGLVEYNQKAQMAIWTLPT